jgi:hypothetical protein
VARLAPWTPRRRAGHHGVAAANPDKALLEFFRTTYEAAAELGHWDRSSLEVDPSRWDRKRQSH